MLSTGVMGSDVERLQRRLVALGFEVGPIDGVFGPRTRSAVQAAQLRFGLGRDGVVGRTTSRALFGVDELRLYDGVNDNPGATGGPSADGASVAGLRAGASNREKLDHAMSRARAMGLRITSTTGGRHTPGSYHYRGRAVDVAGSRTAMARFYREMAQLRPTELFYDPLGGIKNGRQIGAIGGHRNHVHVAF